MYINIDNTGWKAAHEVFGEELRNLLCRWHVDKYVCVYICVCMHVYL